ncbi:hypothetical protein EJB05_49081, partial [Eragrostis curvula]
MARNRRKRKRKGGRAGQPVAADGGVQLGAEAGGDGGDEGGSAEQPRSVLTAEGHLVVASATCGEGAGSRGGATAAEADGHLGDEGGEGGNAGPPRAALTAAEADGHLGDEGGEGGNTGLPRAAEEGHSGANDGCGSGTINGQPGTVEMVEERECHVAATDGAGRGSSGEIDGDRVMDAWKGGSFVLDAVLKWTVGDILNADLFRHKVKKMPASFTSVQDYIEIQSTLLLEEIRASINIGISDLARATTYRGLSILDTSTPHVYYVDIDLNNLDGCSHIAKDGDLFFLRTQPIGKSDYGNSSALESVLCIAEKDKKCLSCSEDAPEAFCLPNKFDHNQLDATRCIASKIKCPHNNATDFYGALLVQARPRFLQNFKELFPSFNLREILVLDDISYSENVKAFPEASLGNRAQELYCCLHVWKGLLKQIDFIMQMKPYCKDQCDHEGLSCTKNSLAVFSLDSFRRKMGDLVSDFGECSKGLISNLSGYYLSDNDVDNINKLLKELSEFMDHMLNINITSSSVQRAFGFHSILSELVGGNALAGFCIEHSRIVICTPSNSYLLLGLGPYLFDTLIVDDAAQIWESDLLIPISVTHKHVVLLGDHLHLPPKVKSEVCQKAGYASSLFERLLLSHSENKILNKQYMMEPEISHFVRQHFYECKVEDGCTVKSHDYNNHMSAYCFFDIMTVGELREKGRDFVEDATVIFLLQKLCKGLMKADEKLNVAVIYVSCSRVDSARKLLGTRYGSNDRINLEICIDKKNMSSSSRSFLWIIGDSTALLASGGAWNELINNAKKRKLLGTMKSNMLDKVMKSLEVNDQDRSTAAKSALQDNMIQKPGQEFTWEGRPNRTKPVLASLRDQKKAPDTCTFQATLATIVSSNKYQCSCLNPPQDYPYDLCFNDLKSKYEKLIAKQFESEEISKRGKHRLETQLDIAKEQGILGRNKADPEEPARLFRIQSHEEINAKEVEKTESLVEGGEIMIGSFRVSRNYFRLRQGETYVYYKEMPYINAKSGLPASHSVMITGHGKQPFPLKGTSTEPSCLRHVHFQNSEGKRFGVNGFGRVARSSLQRRLYRISLPPPAGQIIRN